VTHLRERCAWQLMNIGAEKQITTHYIKINNTICLTISKTMF
jgi:hypothetical protein